MSLDRKHLAVEAAAIFLSILLAFWVDAAWDARVERARAAELLTAVRSDVLAAREYIEGRIAHTDTVTAQATSLLTALAERGDPGTRDSLLLGLGSIFIQFTWSPNNQSYEQALGSSTFELVRDQRLRLLLAHYASTLEEVAFWAEVSFQQYQGELEPFMVAHTVYSELAAPDVRDLLVPARLNTDLESLATSRELWNLLTLKLELEGIVRVALRDALAGADELLAALQS